MFRKLLFAISLILTISTLAHAQSIISVNINTASFQWTAPLTGDAPTEYHVKCGTATGVYTLPIIVVQATSTTLPVKSAIPSSGNYFCVVTAANQFGESPPSNEVNFLAGDIPLSPTNLVIQSK